MGSAWSVCVADNSTLFPGNISKLPNINNPSGFRKCSYFKVQLNSSHFGSGDFPLGGAWTSMGAPKIPLCRKIPAHTKTERRAGVLVTEVKHKESNKGGRTPKINIRLFSWLTFQCQKCISVGFVYEALLPPTVSVLNCSKPTTMQLSSGRQAQFGLVLLPTHWSFGT